MRDSQKVRVGRLSQPLKMNPIPGRELGSIYSPLMLLILVRIFSANKCTALNGAESGVRTAETFGTSRRRLTSIQHPNSITSGGWVPSGITGRQLPPREPLMLLGPLPTRITGRYTARGSIWNLTVVKRTRAPMSTSQSPCGCSVALATQAH